MDLLYSMVEDNNKFNTSEKHDCMKNLKKIIALFEKKKNLFTERGKIRSKLLMDQQILEEHRRRNEENHAYYQEQIDEYKENIEKKEEFEKSYEKKFNEVEIYVQRQSKNSKNPLYDCFFSFEILPFIYANEDLNLKKRAMVDEVKGIRNDIKELLKENVELKKRDDDIDMTEDNAVMEKNNKIKSLIKMYQTKIKFLEKNNEQLKKKLSGYKMKVDKLAFSNLDLNNRIKDECSKKENRKMIKNLEIKIDEEDDIDKKIEEEPHKQYRKESDVVDDTNEEQKQSITTNDKKNDYQEPSLIIKDGFNETNYNEFLINKTNLSVIKDAFGDISCIEKNNN